MESSSGGSPWEPHLEGTVTQKIQVVNKGFGVAGRAFENNPPMPRLPSPSQSLAAGRAVYPAISGQSNQLHPHAVPRQGDPHVDPGPGGTHAPADLHVVREQALQSKGLAQGDLPLQDIALPHLADHLVAELPGEGALIAQKGRAEQAVAQQLYPPVDQLVQVLQPPAAGWRGWGGAAVSRRLWAQSRGTF